MLENQVKQNPIGILVNNEVVKIHQKDDKFFVVAQEDIPFKITIKNNLCLPVAAVVTINGCSVIPSVNFKERAFLINPGKNLIDGFMISPNTEEFIFSFKTDYKEDIRQVGGICVAIFQGKNILEEDELFSQTGNVEFITDLPSIEVYQLFYATKEKLIELGVIPPYEDIEYVERTKKNQFNDFTVISL